MKKTMMALALCLMSAMTFAAGRQVTTTLPTSTPAVTLTIDGKKHVVQAETNPRYQEIMEDVDYLFALCDLGRGRRPKAYRQLKVIAQSDSRHACQAAELIKHFK